MKIHILPAVCAAWLAVCPSSPAPAFMKLGDIKGEAVEANHRDWSAIEVASVQISRQSITNLAGGITIQPKADLTVTKRLDRAAPALIELTATGRPIPLVELHVTRQLADGSQTTFLKYELKNVLITSYSGSGGASGDTLPSEQMSLNFEEIKVTYSVLDRNGRVVEDVIRTTRLDPFKP